MTSLMIRIMADLSAGLPPCGRKGEGRWATLTACRSCSSLGQKHPYLADGSDRMIVAHPGWASLPVDVLPMLHDCPKSRVPTSMVGGMPGPLSDPVVSA